MSDAAEAPSIVFTDQLGSSALSFSCDKYRRHNRKLWLALWIGWLVGPLFMAITGAESIGFGVTKGNTFKWIKVVR